MHWNWLGSAELCKFILRIRSDSSKLGKIRDIVIDTVISTPRGTSTIKGYQDQYLENLNINNVQIFMTPEDAKDKRVSHALVIENVEG